MPTSPPTRTPTWCLPAGSSSISKIYSKLFFDRDPDDPLPVDVLLRTFDERFGGYQALAVHYVWEDLFWRWKHERVA